MMTVSVEMKKVWK